MSTSSSASTAALPLTSQNVARKASLSLKPSPSQTPQPTMPIPPILRAPVSLTTKEWVIPPRPKPGRKPATDTPPTKRKAQNRAAQRAFRERRAARVGDLEEQLKEVEDQYDEEVITLKDTITRLETEAERYRLDLTTWMERCRRFENELSTLQSIQPETVALPQRSSKYTQSDDTSIGCGNCTVDSRCQCIDDAIQEITDTHTSETDPHEKRPALPAIHPGEKRIKLEPRESLEIDFTSLYSSKTSANREQDVLPTSAVADPCGFCSDGTPCICAELATEHTQSPPPARPILQQLGQFTPPPCDGDVSASRLEPQASCSGKPGTCAQCQFDPNSTLFCKSLAASRAQSQPTVASQDGCCGGKDVSGGCCQAPTRTTRSRTLQNTQPPSQPNVTLTCADAYTTLSRHPAYERASHEIGTWLPRLRASEAPSIDGRPAMEIDAANVMAVLKDFDRRFGKEG